MVIQEGIMSKLRIEMKRIKTRYRKEYVEVVEVEVDLSYFIEVHDKENFGFKIASVRLL